MEKSENKNQQVAVNKPVDLLKQMISAPSVQEQFRNALGENKDAFVASLIDLYTGDKSLQTCKASAVVVEALKAATMKLPINRALGFAYIVVYKNKGVPTPTFIPGYRGYIQLAMRTGQYKTINADIVYEGELRTVDKLSGEISFDGKRLSSKVVGYFCYFELLNGFSKTLYMTVEEMAQYAHDFSKSIPKGTSVETLAALANAKQESGRVGWMGNFNAMALKTVIRRLLSKYGYLSIEMQSALVNDIKADYQPGEKDGQQGEGRPKVIDLDDIQFAQDAEPEPVQDAKPADEPKSRAEQPSQEVQPDKQQQEQEEAPAPQAEDMPDDGGDQEGIFENADF